MIPGKVIWKPLVQKAVTGRAGCLTMRRFPLPDWPADLSNPGLYLHVPFCMNLCPYCPYNRVKYREDLYAAFEQAVKSEIDLYAPYLAGRDFVSLYVGGGTPTVDCDGLIRILAHLRAKLEADCKICVELHPANMDSDCLAKLADNGVTMLSIGVESTSDAILKRIGRSHDGKTAMRAVERALAIGFESVNADLMFALPGQTLADWENDVRNTVSLGIDQLSTYPLFAFPYSELGRETGAKAVTRPKYGTVRRMLAFTAKYCEEQNLARCAVWSWLRPGRHKFSSITRHHYVGFGPSAASMTGRHFYVNTFNVTEYARKLPKNRSVAVSMPVNKRLEMAYWLYWRLYELEAGEDAFTSLFGPAETLDDRFGHVFGPLAALKMVEKTGTGYHVTEPGAYWIHRLQNEYSLSYINRLWGTCGKTPWPKQIGL